MPLETLDLWDQATLTDVIVKPIAGALGIGTEGDSLGSRIAPLVPFAGRVAKVQHRGTRGEGQAQLRDKNATPALVSFPGETLSESLMELVDIDEMHRIMESDWQALNSPDENVARAAGRTIIERGQRLALRNARRTESLRWQMLSGEATLVYPTGASIVVNYGLPAGHKPTAGTLWSDATNADPIADLAAWSEVLAADSGFAAKYAHMSTKTWNYMINSAKVKAQINFNAAGANSILRPRQQDIEALLTSFSQDLEIVIYDDGYRADGATGYGRSSLTRYLPDGKVLMTTDYTLGGTRIADVLDGQVMVSNSYNSVNIVQGFNTEVMLDHLSKTHFLRAASARIPRMLIPEAFLWATVAA